MNKFVKLLLPLAGGLLLLQLLFASTATVLATPPPPAQPDPTTCSDCQAVQDDIDTAYGVITGMIENVSNFSMQTEGLITGLEGVFTDPADVKVAMDGIVDSQGYLLKDADCSDPTDSFHYYTSFQYGGTDYCFTDEQGYFDFYNWGITVDTGNEAAWQDVMDNYLPLVTDYPTDDADLDDLMDFLDYIDGLELELADCENLNCPVAVDPCSDCEAIALDLETALMDLDDLEMQADTSDGELNDLETDIDNVLDQFAQLDALRDAFRQIVLDAGGMTDADCDGFEVGPGQSWGIAHNFGDVQWCLTSESQIADFTQGLRDYWDTNGNQHLPTEADLNAQLDLLLNDYLDKLDELEDLLDQIDLKMDEIDQLILDLSDCLAELAILQDGGECLDQDLAALGGVIDNALMVMDMGYMPTAPTPAPVGPAFSDTDGHWADGNILNLKTANVVSGDGDTGLFRPNDSINRAEAAKIVPLALQDTLEACNEALYPDVFLADWFCEFVSTSTVNGYFEGYGDGTFRPPNLIVRAEAVAVVMRATGLTIPTYTTYSFPDVNGDEWFADYAEKAFECGFVEGRNGMLEPGSEITRAEFAKIIDVALLSGPGC